MTDMTGNRKFLSSNLKFGIDLVTGYWVCGIIFFILFVFLIGFGYTNNNLEEQTAGWVFFTLIILWIPLFFLLMFLGFKLLSERINRWIK